MNVLRFIKDWMLPLAMITGALAYQFVSQLAFITPFLVFMMLLFTFCRLSPKQISFHPAHLWLLLIQVFGCGVVYFLIRNYHPIVAQGALICVLAPTATAAAVITGMLGGSVGFLTSYLLLCNVAVALAAPAVFPLINVQSDLSFWNAFLMIISQVGPVLLLPLGLAWFLRYTFPAFHAKLARRNGISFYLWAAGLTIVTGSMVKFLIHQEHPDYKVELGLALVALIICVLQFIIGRSIGRRYGDPVSAGQGLGQKNTVLAIWMAQAYLNPVSSVAPAAYVLWQNCINSWQLWRKRKREP